MTVMLGGAGMAHADPVTYCSTFTFEPRNPGTTLPLSCMNSAGGSPASPADLGKAATAVVPGSYQFTHGFGGPTGQLDGSTSTNYPAGFGFYDDFVFTITDAIADAIASTIEIQNLLNISGLQLRLFSLASNTVPTLGVPNPTAAVSWSSQISGQGFSGTVVVIPVTTLAAGTYVLEARGNVTGQVGGSYSGVLNLAPVPLPAAAWLLLSGLGGLAAFARGKWSVVSRT
jgi:hypothetical protein